MAKGV